MDKAGLRAAHRARRREREARPDESLRVESLQRMLQAHGVGPHMTLAGYMPTRTEPDVLPCLAWAWQWADRVVVPRTLPGCQLEWVRWSPDVALGPDRHGLVAPDGEAISSPWDQRPTVILVPALAVDRVGTRLGNGAGYYDRALAPLPRWPAGPLRAAVVHPDEITMQPIAAQPHDQPVDAVLTGSQWHALPL